MDFCRFYTSPENSPFDGVDFCSAYGEDGKEYIVPSSWNNEAVDILIAKCFYKGKIPSKVMKTHEKGVPAFLSASTAQNKEYLYETNFKNLVTRVAGFITYKVWKSGLFDKESSARNFYDELVYCFVHRLVVINTELFASVGLNWAYGIEEKEKELQNSISNFTGTLEELKVFARSITPEDKDFRVGVTLDIENYQCRDFIKLKATEEESSVACELGKKLIARVYKIISEAYDRNSIFGSDPSKNSKMKIAIDHAKELGASEALIDRAIGYAEQQKNKYLTFNLGEKEINFESSIECNLSVPDSFFEAALTKRNFTVYENKKEKKNLSASDVFHDMAEAVWLSGEPSILFRDNVKTFSPCGENLYPSSSGGFLFLPRTSAPSASLNLIRFIGERQDAIDMEALSKVVKIFTIALDALTSDEDYRPIVLSPINMAELLLCKGIAYDSSLGRTTAALIVSFVSAVATNISTQIAVKLGAFKKYKECEKNIFNSIKGKIAFLDDPLLMEKGATRKSLEINFNLTEETLLGKTIDIWRDTYMSGKISGFRNAHLTAIDTSFEEQILLGALTQNINPLQSLINFGDNSLYGKSLNSSAILALKSLGYNALQIETIGFYILGHGSLVGAPFINNETLRERGFDENDLLKANRALLSARNIYGVFNNWVLQDKPNLEEMGFTTDEIEDANFYCCGALTVEGAPYLKPEHINVFDCLNYEADKSTRRISPDAIIKMRAAVETFTSGAVAGVVEVNHHTSIDEIKNLIMIAWETGVKRLKIYRNGCSLFL